MPDQNPEVMAELAGGMIEGYDTPMSANVHAQPWDDAVKIVFEGTEATIVLKLEADHAGQFVNDLSDSVDRVAESQIDD